jgi:hypothetical protein
MNRWLRCLHVPRPCDVVIGDEQNPYMLRWHVIPRNRVFNIYLHRFCRSDEDVLHDHPWWNMSVIVWGSYTEQLRNRRRITRWPFIPVIRHPMTAHRIILRNDNNGPRPVWSLFVTGPKVRTWGFWCGERWVEYKEYVSPTTRGNQVGKGCGE